MCGRYQLNVKPRRLREVFKVAVPEDLCARFNIAPSQMAPIVRDHEAELNPVDLKSIGPLQRGERRVATRYDHPATQFLSMVKLAMIQRCLRLLDPLGRT